MFKIGDLVVKSYNNKRLPDFNAIGVVVRVHLGIYFVEWIKTNEQYAYEAKELKIVSEA